MVEPQARNVKSRGIQLSAIFSRFRVWLKRQIVDRVLWVADQPRGLHARAASTSPWIVIVGRENYEISVTRVPIRGWLDARRASEFVKSEGAWSMAVVGDWDGSHRTVTLYRVDVDVNEFTSRAPFCFFETQLLSRSLSIDEVLSIDRFGFRYFLAPPDRSQVAGSLIDDPGLFALSIGAPQQSISSKRVDASAAADLLLKALSNLRALLWIQAINRGFLIRSSALVTPAVRLSLLIFTTYFACSTAYLWALKSIREQQLSTLGSEVAVLLDTQRKVDLRSKEVNAVTSIVNSRVYSYQSWELVPVVWDSGGVVLGMTFKEGRAVIRGATSDATSLLSAISKNPRFAAARFDSPLRESAGRQDFSIGVTLSQAKVP